MTFKLNLADLVFILKQIKIAEANAKGVPLTEVYVDAEGNTMDENGVPYTADDPGVTLAIPSPMAPFGLRTVDGSNNNIVPGREKWGAADQVMPRLLTPHYRNEGDESAIDINGPAPGGILTNTNYGASGDVVDSDPRTISNLIVDMSINNPAAVIAALTYAGSEDPQGDMQRLYAARVTQAEADAALAAAQAAVTTATAALNAAIQGYISDPGTLPVVLAALAAITAANQAAADAQVVADDPEAAFLALAAEMGIEISASGSLVIPNVAPDEGLSAPFNAWMTFFGQFFDHGLDLINKGGEGTVYIPLKPDDPLITHGPDGIAGTGDEVPPNLAFMVLTRASEFPESVNQTTPFVDQNQTYTSHASHQVFLREYITHEGRTVATGKLLDGPDGNSLPTWADVKAQARSMLGIELTNLDVLNLPLLRTDAYGNFIPHPTTGYAQVITGVGLDGIPNTADDVVVSGTPASPVSTFTAGALRTGHAFLDDIANAAQPINSRGQVLTADADNVVNTGTPAAGTYDNELLDRHFITGDGRGNENIGLTAVHHVFHSEHNRQITLQKLEILKSGDLDFINEWLLVPLTQPQLNALMASQTVNLQTWIDNLSVVWDGERLFQGARMATEMQYQHLVFEEFARKIQPNIDVFVFNTLPDINPAIFAEFAHVVYRFGHSMLTDNMPRVDENGLPMDSDLGLVEAFLNPVLFDNNGAITDDEATAALVRGMTRERGNEIDEFVVNALRNNLLGLPLDLAAINIARGRDTGMPSLNEARAQLYAASGSTFLKPYDHWIDFAANLKNPMSVINFIAAYGTHASITGATTLEAKRDAAMNLVFGGSSDPIYADRMAFLTGTGAYANKGGLNDIDLWIGGLAEKKMPFGGFLGSTFNAIFELQLENLQDGDRFYYLTRTQGQNFLNELEQNAFSKLIMANSNLTDPGPDGIRGTADDIVARHIGIDAFARYDFVLEVDPTKQSDPDPVGNDPVLEAMGMGKVVRDDPTTPQVETNYIRFTGGEHTVFGGTNGNDTIIADFGDDAIWGGAGNDRIEAGAGVDLVNGGYGDDIITDSGDTGDFLKGEEGDDVIANSNGLDIIMGGSGKDVIFVGVDATEVFAGEGDDFVLGGDDMDFLMGNEGDDWLEGGRGFDTTAGDNSELFFDSRIIGHDVMFAGADEHDFDAESGDDIMVQGESVIRNEGMFGFDWATYKGVQKAADADLTRAIFLTEVEDILRNRFDKVEGLSGWNYNDFLMGDDRTFAPLTPGDITATTENTFFRDELNIAGLNRIAGLNQILTPDMFFTGIYGADWSDTSQLIFSGGNVITGGGGSDQIFGRGGNDVLDGDRWLNVRIRITQPGAENTAGNQIATIDSLKHVFTAQDAGHPSWVGKSLFELMIDRVVVPSQLHIVRELLNGNQAGDVDTAVYWDVIENYTITAGPNGSVIVSHDTVTPANLSQAAIDLGFRPVSDGIDRLYNIEQLRFADGNGGFITYGMGEVVQFAATGAPVVDDTTPIEGQLLTAVTTSIADINGLGTFQYQWQRSGNGTQWTNIGGANAQTFSVPDAAGTGISAFANQFLRVIVTFTDGMGNIETLTSAATSRIGVNMDASALLTAVNFVAPATDDRLVGTALNDTLDGANGNDVIIGGAGNDELFGRNGDDVLTGGAGNDIIAGGANVDVAVFSGPVINYRITDSGTDIIVGDMTGVDGDDTVRDVEILRFGAVDYAVVNGTAGVDTAINGPTGADGNQAIFGRAGGDTLNGGEGSDILVGGNGVDRVNGGGGDDFIFQTSTDNGRDIIDGGAGSDTYILNGVAGAETFRIYTRAEAVLAGFGAGLQVGTEIVITRTVGATTTVLAELDNVEEIKINSLVSTANNGNGLVDGGTSGGDTVIVIGNFAAPNTSLDYSTITITGSSGNDTVDITGLTSDHRVVFNSNGGTDTLVGDLRPQDVFNGVTTVAQPFVPAPVIRDEARMPLPIFGAGDGLEALIPGITRGSLFSMGSLYADGVTRIDPVNGRFASFSSNDFELTQFVLSPEPSAYETAYSRTIVESHLEIEPVDLSAFARGGASALPVVIDTAPLSRLLFTADHDLLAY